LAQNFANFQNPSFSRLHREVFDGKHPIFTKHVSGVPTSRWPNVPKHAWWGYASKAVLGPKFHGLSEFINFLAAKCYLRWQNAKIHVFAHFHIFIISAIPLQP
jgi:hypothetical protein